MAAHATRSDLERSLCEELARQGVGHEHRSLHFRVDLESGERRAYDPAIVVRRGDALFVIEPLDGDGDAERVETVTRFLEQHSPEIVFILVAPATVLESLPPEAYDEAYPSEAFARAVERVRDQDPTGFLEPFRKQAERESEDADLREDGKMIRGVDPRRRARHLAPDDDRPA